MMKRSAGPLGAPQTSMPISIHIDGDGIAVATGSGVLRLGDARDAASALWSAAGWKGRSAVWDLREAELEVSSIDTRELAQFVLEHQPTPPPKRIAIVTRRDVDFGMARMFEVYREDPATAIRIFRDYDEALGWAGCA
jgi:hypothetical protein